MSDDKGMVYLAVQWELTATKEEMQVGVLSEEPRARALARIRTLRACAKQLRALAEMAP